MPSSHTTAATVALLIFVSMNLSQLSGSTWNSAAAQSKEINSQESGRSEVEEFKDVMKDPRYSELRLRDLFDTTRQSSQRQICDSPIVQKGINDRLSLNIPTPLEGSKSLPSSPVKGSPHKKSRGMVKKLESANLVNVMERPANRKQIMELEQYLIHQVKDAMSDGIMTADEVGGSPLSSIKMTLSKSPEKKSGSSMPSSPTKLSPLKKNIDVRFILNKKKLCEEYRISPSDLIDQPWLDRLIVCDNLNMINDDVAHRFCDMISVSSSEHGGVMRKLRRTYQQTFQLMRASWDELYAEYIQTSRRLGISEENNRALIAQLNDQEDILREKLEGEMKSRRDEIEAEKAQNDEKLRATEVELEQTVQTLATLNSIFKTMQSDSSITTIGDLRAKNEKLEKEYARLKEASWHVEQTNHALEVSQGEVEKLKRQLNLLENDISNLRLQVNKRDSTVAQLMEREALREAEIEKLKEDKASLEAEEEHKDIRYEEPPTAVLCVKCKKRLDDMTNIREAVMGGPTIEARVKCRSYRTLLPNIKGRRPVRTNDWVRLCMRSILAIKMREDVSLHAIKGSITRFPEFTYAWFEPAVEHPTPEALVRADEDRWGFYYAVKALSR